MFKNRRRSHGFPLVCAGVRRSARAPAEADADAGAAEPGPATIAVSSVTNTAAHADGRRTVRAWWDM
jgi:hypothetical protein